MLTTPSLTRHCMVWLTATVSLMACNTSGTPTQPTTTTAQTTAGTTTASKAEPEPSKPVPEPHVPLEKGPFSPSLATLVKGDKADLSVLTETKSCGTDGCHATINKEWQESMHAFASLNNPYYLVSFDQFIADADHTKGKFCNGCHEPAYQFLAKPQQIEPDDPKAYSGVGCGTCHSVVAATTDGNASYTLTTAPIPVPKEGDPESLARHKARVGKGALRSDALCASCHHAFLSPETGHDVFVDGANDFSPWRRSGYAGSKASRIDEATTPMNCTGCHMPRLPRTENPEVGPTYVSHRFPGGHTTFADNIDAPEQLAAVEKLLKTAADLSIVPLARIEGTLAPSESEGGFVKKTPLVFDVVVFNKGVGHHFPGGVRDLRDTWLEVVVRDASGKVLAESGVEHATSGTEKGIFRQRALLLSSGSDAVFEHAVASFRTAVFDRTIGPRDTAIARYTWTPPEGEALALPLNIQARLRHRRLQRAIRDKACAIVKTPRGKKFVKNTKRYNGFEPDPCRDQPILDLATAAAWTGKGAAAKTPEPMPWKRLLRHGQGLTHHVQERLDEALVSLKAAEAALPTDAPVWGRAAVLLEQGRVLGRQGRTDDASAMFLKVDGLMPNHPATAFARAKANAQVWRWEKAAAAYRDVVRLAPLDDRGWRGLTIALGSLSKRHAALDAALKGLALEQRDPHLLRSQSIAFAKLAKDTPKAKLAQKTWLKYRRDEASPNIKGDCNDPDSDCQRERVPIPNRPLKTAAP